jgi:hypothetical protein
MMRLCVNWNAKLRFAKAREKYKKTNTIFPSKKCVAFALFVSEARVPLGWLKAAAYD